MILELEDWLRLTQIVFYCVAGTLALATYFKAKNGLLNAVNTEYQKRVMDRLAEISTELVSEFDPHSDKFWSKNSAVSEIVDIYHNDFLHLNELVKDGISIENIEHHNSLNVPGVIVSELQSYLRRMASVLKSDPFIPQKIKENLVDYYRNRADILADVLYTEIEPYKVRLRMEIGQGATRKDLEDRKWGIHNSVNDLLNEQGCGISDNERGVNEIREEIQQYLEQFNSLI